MPKAHICILTTAHPIDDVRVFEKFACSFLSSGYRVSWVGPNHAFFDEKASRASKIEFHLSPGNPNALRRLFASREIYRAATHVHGVDVYYAPEPDSAELALRLSRDNHARVILDLHEVYHGPSLTRWLGKLAIPMVREYVRRRIERICDECDLVIGVSGTVLAYYVTEQVHSLVIRSCAPSWFANAPPSDVCSPHRANFTLMHGKRSLLRGTEYVLNGVKGAASVAGNLKVIMFHHLPPTVDPEYPLFCAAVDNGGLGNVLDLRAGVPMHEMPAVLRECDVGLIAYGKELGLDSLPNRLFEYMAAGLPVIVPKYAAEIVAIVESEQCGLAIDFEDSSEVERAILQLWRNPDESRQMGLRGRLAFELRHNWENELKPALDCIGTWERGSNGN